MSRPEISVVIPVYNAERYLEECLASVLSQEGADFEVIAINDGSTDRSTEILRRYADRIRLIEQANVGFKEVRNVALKHVQGRLVALLDADDRYLPGHLARLAEFEKSRPEAVGFYGDAWLIDPQGQRLWVHKTPQASFENLVMGNYIIHSSVALRKSFFDRGETYHHCGPAGDWELWFRAMEHGPLVHHPWIGVEYRKHPESAMHQNQEEAEEWTFRILDWVFEKHKELSAKTRNQALTRAYYDRMGRFLAADKPKEARARALNCLRRDPAMFKAWVGLLVGLAPPPAISAAISLRRQILKWFARIK